MESLGLLDYVKSRISCRSTEILMKTNQPIAVLLLIIHMVDIIDRRHYLDFESTGAQSEETE